MPNIHTKKVTPIQAKKSKTMETGLHFMLAEWDLNQERVCTKILDQLIKLRPYLRMGDFTPGETQITIAIQARKGWREDPATGEYYEIGSFEDLKARERLIKTGAIEAPRKDN